jgi:diacylglycerol O-acyltransferase
MAAGHKHRETFSTVDTAWLHMEKPTNPAMITGVILFDKPLDFERLRATIEYRLLPYHRFVQRAREPRFGLGLPQWEDDPHFNLDSHLHRIALPAPGDQAALQELVGDLMSTSLDFTKPLWQIHVVENVQTPQGIGSAMIPRLHHCIADGIALMQVVLSMADEDPDAPWPEPPERVRRRFNPLGWVFRPVKTAARLTGATIHTSITVAHESFHVVTNPKRRKEMAKTGVDGGRALAKLLLIPPDKKTIFRGPTGVKKRAAWSDPISLEEVKAIGKAMDCTINDVVITAVTGALRRYLEKRGQPTEGLDFRAILPVNLRPPDELEQLGNRFGLVFLSLPIGIQDPIKRLLVIKRRMDQIKDTPEAAVAFGILYTIGMTPSQIEDIIIKIFSMKGTAVITNVPGPKEKLYFAGREIKNFVFWVPAPGDLGMGVSIFSYKGHITVGVETDVRLVPDPETIVQAFHTEFEQLKLWMLVDEVKTPQPPIEAAPPQEPVEQAAPEPVAEEAPAGMCQALTKAGQPCKNRALPGASTCRVHQG